MGLEDACESCARLGDGSQFLGNLWVCGTGASNVPTPLGEPEGGTDEGGMGTLEDGIEEFGRKFAF